MRCPADIIIFKSQGIIRKGSDLFIIEDQNIDVFFTYGANYAPLLFLELRGFKY